MPDFLLLLRGGDEHAHDFSLEELQVHVNKYFAWIETLHEAGHFKGGQPLAAEGKIVSGASKQKPTVTDGPFAESKEAIRGYFLIKADDLDQAVELAKGCPGLEVGGSLEVRPIAVDIQKGLQAKMETIS